MQYLNCVSGALVYDRKREKIYTKTLDVKTIQKLIDIASYEDDMVHLLTWESIIQKYNLDKRDAYHMSVYQDMYKKVTIK